MPIEFRCTHCDRLLRTPDGTSGKEAKCPQCGAIVRIPATAVPPAAVPSSAPVPASANPYQAPAAAGPDVLIAEHSPRRCFEPTKIELGEVFNRAWEIFKLRWPACLATVWGTTALLWVAMVPFGIAAAVLAGPNRKPGPEVLIVYVPFLLVLWWQVVTLPGLMLKIARGENVAVRDLTSFGGAMIPGLLAMLLSGILSMVGYCLCIIPGVIVALMFSQCLFLVLDRRAGIIESLQLSMRATSGNKLTLFLLMLLVGIAGFACTVLTCGLAAFVVQPFFALLQCVAYLAMTGQSTAVGPAAGRERQFG